MKQENSEIGKKVITDRLDPCTECVIIFKYVPQKYIPEEVRVDENDENKGQKGGCDN